MSKKIMDYSKFNPIYFMVRDMKAENPHISLPDITMKIKNLGVTKKNGKYYSQGDIDHIYKNWKQRAAVIEMIKEKERIRKMDNYPPGAANDPNAPYNEKDSDFWREEKNNGICQYCQKEDVGVDENETCENCFYDHKESW